MSERTKRIPTTPEILAALATNLMQIAVNSGPRASFTIYGGGDETSNADITFFLKDGGNFSLNLYEFLTIEENMEILVMARFLSEDASRLEEVQNLLYYSERNAKIRKMMEAANE